MSSERLRGNGRYAAMYRAKEIAALAKWVQAGFSGAVVGLAGSGKSNLMSVLGEEPERMQHFLGDGDLPLALVAVDLNNLADNQVVMLYRLMLRALYEARSQFDQALQTLIASQYNEHKTAVDPFIVQNAIRDLLHQVRDRQMRLVLLFDQFDVFCRNANQVMANSLRGLRDGFKENICYIVGMRQAVTYLPDPNVLGELYELLDLHTLWLGPMSAADSRRMIELELLSLNGTSSQPFDIDFLIQLTGGFPSLIKAACRWWRHQSSKLISEQWPSQLLQDFSMQHRLREIWDGLDQAEQSVLYALARGIKPSKPIAAVVWERVIQKGVCVERGAMQAVNGELLQLFVQTAVTASWRKLWLDLMSNQLYQGEAVLDKMPPLEHAVLAYLVKNPEAKLTKTQIIENAWPPDTHRNGVSDESLYTVIRGIRKRIEPKPSKPIFLETWRGTPEGGYLLYLDGRRA
ncbi:MAG: winged helix-turn-helix domain-containing protein [Chloroflexi bacterium]|nr:winged helix-turn-helix domain-containing protein [Chloroflexota bacterium]